jgi:sugar/nucleoside kinase (ribokinase family)
MTHTFDFIGVGGLAYDLMLRVDRLPLGDDKYPAELLGKLPGGFIANATCAAARLGLKTAFAGWVGDDAEGTMLHDDFEAWKVDPVGLVRVPDAVTPYTIVATDHKGQRAILLPHWLLYNAELTYNQLMLARQARVVYTFPRDMVWCRDLRRASLEGHGLFALDVESAVPMRGDELREVVTIADILFVTETSLTMLGLKSIRDLAEPRQWVIQTAGSRGAYGIEGGQRKPVFQPARRVRPVDTTGAGDCFHAALIAARLNGATLEESLAFANAAASIKVLHAGARGGLPTRQEVIALLKR